MNWFVIGSVLCVGAPDNQVFALSLSVGIQTPGVRFFMLDLLLNPAL